MSVKHYFGHVYLKYINLSKTSELPVLDNQKPVPKDDPDVTKSFVQQ